MARFFDLFALKRLSRSLRASQIKPVSPAAPAWVLTVDTTDANQTWSVTIETGYSVDITVDWGDGTVETFTTLGNKTHTYAAAGRHYPRITGSFSSGGNIRLGYDETDSIRLKATSRVPFIPGFVSFYNTFYGCTGLTSLPADLFRYNTLISIGGFNRTFYGCTGLTSLPADLFRYNTLVSEYGFNRTFYGCTGLTSLPADLFRYNTLISIGGFNRTFYGCTGLTSLPADLFRYNTLVSEHGFYGTFSGCTGLTSLPTDLFRYNTLVSDAGFYGTFSGCTGLTSLPTDLFRYNTLVSEEGFYETFYGCNKLQLRSDIFFPPEEAATRFLNQSPDFTNCFYITDTFTGTQGTAPELWSCSFGTGTPTTTDCFTGQTSSSVTNHASIPTAWGGPT